METEDDELGTVARPGSEALPLLPGEELASDHLDDVEHWVAVYEELIGFLLASRPDPTDTLERYRRRLAHWRRLEHRGERLDVPGGQPGDGPVNRGAS